MEKIFVVLGMHRSATSLVAGGIKCMGVDVGKNLLGAIPTSNPKGHFENMEFLELNQKILKTAGGSWRDVPSEESILQAGYLLRNEIKQTIDRNRNIEGLWGWKDPRTTLTIKCYLPFLNIQAIHYICNFRNPVEVGQSLFRRGDMSVEAGVNLANIYNSRLVRFLSEQM